MRIYACAVAMAPPEPTIVSFIELVRIELDKKNIAPCMHDLF